SVVVNPSGWFMYVVFGLYGFAAYPLYAIAVAHANDFAKEGEFARVAGAMLLILGIGLAIGPIIASWVMQALRPVDLFIVTATFHGALAVTAFLRMKIRPVREGGRVRFRVMNAEKGISPGTVALDPRADEDSTNDNDPGFARKAAPARDPEIIVPDAVEPVVVIEGEAKPKDAPESKKDGEDVQD